jgi:hypothetical protein
MPKELIDQQEVFGFALADGLGMPILPGDRARTVGQSGDDVLKGANGTANKPGRLRREKDAARERIRKARGAAVDAADAVQRVAEVEDANRLAMAKLLGAPVKLKLPNETVGAKRKRPVAEQPGGALREARAAHKTAERAEDEAAARVELCEQRQERARRGLEALGPLPAEVGMHIQPESPCERCSTRFRKKGRTGDLWHCKECKEKVQRARDAEERRDKKLSAKWTCAQEKVDAADDELRDARDAWSDASLDRSLARNELFYATERDLREKNRHLRAENARLRALVDSLGGGHPHASVSESESES